MPPLHVRAREGGGGRGCLAQGEHPGEWVGESLAWRTGDCFSLCAKTHIYPDPGWSVGTRRPPGFRGNTEAREVRGARRASVPVPAGHGSFSMDRRTCPTAVRLSSGSTGSFNGPA